MRVAVEGQPPPPPPGPPPPDALPGSEAALINEASAHSSGAEEEGGGAETMLTSQLALVDLAGCEQLSQSKAVGQQLREAVGINSSLLVLGKCISALSEGRAHVPHRGMVRAASGRRHGAAAGHRGLLSLHPKASGRPPHPIRTREKRSSLSDATERP